RQAQGITLEDGSKVTSLPVPACTIAEAQGPITHLLLATKTLHVLDALDSVRHLIDAQTRLVMLQNGLRLQRELSAAWGAQRVFCLSTTHGAWRRERSEEHTSELQSRENLVCRLLLEKKNI